VGGWVTARRAETALSLVGSGRQRLLAAKDIAVAGVVVTGLASAAGGVGFAQQAPEGAVPMATGSEPAPETPDRAAAIKRITGVLGGLNLAAEVSLVTVMKTISSPSSTNQIGSRPS